MVLVLWCCCCCGAVAATSLHARFSLRRRYSLLQIASRLDTHEDRIIGCFFAAQEEVEGVAAGAEEDHGISQAAYQPSSRAAGGGGPPKAYTVSGGRVKMGQDGRSQVFKGRQQWL